MVRAPCCEKMGLKKGPWTPEEDQVLINYIQLYGHGNWRALPKQAGLLRCGKSCRLRWTNYLRPDIKRGNFSREEEDTIIKLHEMLGNRWSAIAARLPGRTDNEIKNVWHTHLKKRLKQNQANPATKQSSNNNISKYYNEAVHELELEPVNFSSHAKSESLEYRTVSPQECSSDMSTVTMSDNNNENKVCLKVESPRNFPEMDEKFWSEFSTENSEVVMSELSAVDGDAQLQFQFSPQECSSDMSTVTMSDNNNENKVCLKVESPRNFPEMDEKFWSEFSTENSEVVMSELSAVDGDAQLQFQFSPLMTMEPIYGYGSNMHDSMDYFWFNLFNRAGELPELPDV